MSKDHKLFQSLNQTQKAPCRLTKLKKSTKNYKKRFKDIKMTRIAKN